MSCWVLREGQQQSLVHNVRMTNNSGTFTVAGIPLPQSRIPYYSVHPVGVQSSFILPKRNLVGFFKYYDEYRALARPEGRTIVFGFSWTLRIPKLQAPKP